MKHEPVLVTCTAIQYLLAILMCEMGVEWFGEEQRRVWWTRVG
jgi:hypothetical protein